VEQMYSSTHSLTLALDGGEWSASCPSCFTPRERAPGTHWIGGQVGPRAVLDAEVVLVNSLSSILPAQWQCELMRREKLAPCNLKS
jgi:hypothetical protein